MIKTSKHVYRNLQSDIPVHWFVKDLPIYAKGDRIYVTPSHILVVEELGLADSNLYRYAYFNKIRYIIKVTDAPM